MVRPVDLFRATVEEALFHQLRSAEGDRKIALIVGRFSEIVDGFSLAYLSEHLLAAFPRTVEMPDGSISIDAFWEQPATFGPLYAELARSFYDAVGLVDDPAPQPIIIPDSGALFGLRLDGFTTPRVWGAGEQSVFAAAVAVAVDLIFTRPAMLPVAYALATRNSSTQQDNIPSRA